MDLISKAVAAKPTADSQIQVTLSSMDVNSVGNLVGKLFGIIGIIAGLLVFFYLVYSGFIYLTAGGNSDQAKKGQQGIINAAIGLIIIVLAWAIFQAFRGTTQSIK